jgi:hypothetical protein
MLFLRKEVGMAMQPYIGIVGVTNPSEAVIAASIIEEYLPRQHSHIGQIGVQVNDKSLGCEVTPINRRLPKVTHIPEMFDCASRIHDRVFNVIHFTTKKPDTLFESVRKLMSIGNMYTDRLCQGIQFNGGFDRVKKAELEKISDAYPDLKIIMQIPESDISSFRFEAIAHELGELEEYLDYVLIDPSGGLGKVMDVSRSVSLAKKIKAATIDLSLGFTGGFRGDNAQPIIFEIQELFGVRLFSVDAEGALRDRRGDGYGNDDFNGDKGIFFFKNAAAAFCL